MGMEKKGKNKSTMGGQGASGIVNRNNAICCIWLSSRLAQCICYTQTLSIVAFHALPPACAVCSAAALHKTQQHRAT